MNPSRPRRTTRPMMMTAAICSPSSQRPSVSAAVTAALLAAPAPGRRAGPEDRCDGGEGHPRRSRHAEHVPDDHRSEEAGGLPDDAAHAFTARATTASSAITASTSAHTRIRVPGPISHTPSADAAALRTPATPTAHRTSPSQHRSAAPQPAGTRAGHGGTLATPGHTGSRTSDDLPLPQSPRDRVQHRVDQIETLRGDRVDKRPGGRRLHQDHPEEHVRELSPAHLPREPHDDQHQQTGRDGHGQVLRFAAWPTATRAMPRPTRTAELPLRNVQVPISRTAALAKIAALPRCLRRAARYARLAFLPARFG